MDRRRFLQVAGLAGLAVMAPVALREGRADPVKYKGPFWITVNAGGGWDPTMLCDPKGGTAGDPKAVDQAFTKGQIAMAGALSFAPLTYSVDGVEVQSAAGFFTKHHARLMALNGIDTSTNNHDSGSRTIWSGQLAEGYPSFAALVAAAAVAAQPVPLAYLSGGGYDATAGIVALTRVGNTDAIQRLAYPNVIDPTNATSPTYHSQATASRIAAAQADRLKALQGKQSLPTVGAAMSSLFLARQGTDGLSALGDELKSLKVVTIDDIPDLAPIVDRYSIGDLQSLMQQAQLTAHAFKAGVAVSANLDIGGFDTHGDNDNRQIAQMMQLLRGLDYLFDTLDALGLASQTYVLVGSDFGRTPYYNEQAGKDHWNITSMLLAGPQIPKDHVVGATDAGFKPMTFDAKSLKPAASGVRIEPTHVHRGLRKIAGVTGTDLDKQFPLAGEDLPLFS